MSKYLTKPCVDIRIVTLQVSRKLQMIDDVEQWQTYAVVMGEAIDEDGAVLEKINRKFNVGSPGPNDWDADSFEADMITISAQIKAKYNQVLANYTTE